MSIFHNTCAGGASGGAGTALPVGTRISVQGALPTPVGYRRIDGLAGGVNTQGHALSDFRILYDTLDAEPVNGVSATYSVGRANNGILLYQNGSTLSAGDIMFRLSEGDGNNLYGPAAWPAELQSAGVTHICALDVVADDGSTQRVAAVVATATAHHAILWDISGFDWTEVAVSSQPAGTGTLLPQCFSYFVDGDDVRIGVRRAQDWLVFDTETGTTELLTNATGGDSPGFNLDAGLASRPDGSTLFGSRTDNLVRVRKLSIIDQGAGRVVASSFKSTALAVSGVQNSTLAVVVPNVTDDDFTILGPYAWHQVTIEEFVASARQIAGRHPLLTVPYAIPLAGTYLSSLVDIFALIVCEKQESGKYTISEIDMSRVTLLDTFFCDVQKTE